MYRRWNLAIEPYSFLELELDQNEFQNYDDLMERYEHLKHAARHWYRVSEMICQFIQNFYFSLKPGHCPPMKLPLRETFTGAGPRL